MLIFKYQELTIKFLELFWIFYNFNWEYFSQLKYSTIATIALQARNLVLQSFLGSWWWIKYNGYTYVYINFCFDRFIPNAMVIIWTNFFPYHWLGISFLLCRMSPPFIIFYSQLWINTRTKTNIIRARWFTSEYNLIFM
jgi:hypothetical protein